MQRSGHLPFTNYKMWFPPKFHQSDPIQAKRLERGIVEQIHQGMHVRGTESQVEAMSKTLESDACSA